MEKNGIGLTLSPIWDNCRNVWESSGTDLSKSILNSGMLRLELRRRILACRS
jgi:hypothetical protein